jgi:hypothetical protein
MTAAARKRANNDIVIINPAARPSPLAVFTLRCWARARLFAEGEIDLHEAVDQLQANAVRTGLVKQIGQDAVQAIMAETFAAVREDLPKFGDISDDTWAAPSWHDAVAKYHEARGNDASIVPYAPDELERLRRLLAPDVTLERAWRELNKPSEVATSTLMAAEHLVREGDAKRLRQWLDRHSAPEREAILQQLEQRQRTPAT